MTPLRYGPVLTTDETITDAGDKVMVAIVSDGSPQLGNKHVTVLTLETFPLGTEDRVIEAWYEQVKMDKPWEAKQ